MTGVVNYAFTLSVILCIIGKDSGYSLGIFNLSFKDHLLQFFNRMCLYIHKFILIQMLMGTDQVSCHINFDFFVAKCYSCSKRDQPFQIITAISGLFF